MKHVRPLPFVLFLIAIVAWEPAAPEQPVSQVESVHAFAKLYGYVRYFHPSDEAASIDWERFAVHGVRQVRAIKDAAGLRTLLDDLFLPIAPTVQLYAIADGPPPSPELTPDDTSGLKVVAWQHKGIGMGTSPAYESRRTNRIETKVPQPSYAYLQQNLGAERYRGRLVRLTVKARAEVAQGQAYVLLGEGLASGEGRILGGHEPPSVTTAEWDVYVIEGTVDETADSLTVGLSMIGNARLWADDFLLTVQTEDGAWEAVSLANASFEEGAVGEAPERWAGEGKGYLLTTVEGDADKAGRAGHIRWTGEAQQISEPLFEEHPEPGETVHKPIGAGLAVQLPVALYSRDGHTLGTVDETAVAQLREALEAVDLQRLTATDEDLRLADIVIAWNVLRHAYPYFDVVEVDWDAVLSSTIEDALDDEGVDDFFLTLRRMVAELRDGHGSVGHASLQGKMGLPVLPALVEGRLVAVAVGPSSPFEVGDVILSIDGEPALGRVENAMALRSGTEGWRRNTVLRSFEAGEPNSTVAVVVERDGEDLDMTATRSQAGMLFESRPPNVAEIENGIYYINLDRAEVSEINEQISAVAAADGIIFDLRGYPNGNHMVLQHLTNTPLQSARWNIPKMIYPDHEDLVGYDTTGRWTLPPREPRFRGKAVFLVDEKAISYAESVMGIVEAYGLAEIVGRPTAGTNGNINRIQLPGGFTVVFTGMRVLKHDGSQHHLVGIQPTIPVERTIDGVRAGRDEYIDKAIDVIRR